MKDARESKPIELAIVKNLLKLAEQKDFGAPALEMLLQALEIIEQDRWELKDENVQEVGKIYTQLSEQLYSPKAPCSSTKSPSINLKEGKFR